MNFNSASISAPDVASDLYRCTEILRPKALYSHPPGRIQSAPGLWARCKKKSIQQITHTISATIALLSREPVSIGVSFSPFYRRLPPPRHCLHCTRLHNARHSLPAAPCIAPLINYRPARYARLTGALRSGPVIDAAGKNSYSVIA